MFGASSLARAGISNGNSTPEIRGKVCSGNDSAATPLAEATVCLYKATSSQPLMLGTAITDDSGAFLIRLDVSGPETDGIFYATADLSSGLQLVSILGPELLSCVVINELTTVAAGYAFAQFATEGVIQGDPFGLKIAAGMNENLVAPSSGDSSLVMKSSPNADQTNAWRSTLALANLLALYVRGNGNSVDTFYGYATLPGGSCPVNLLQALSNMARFPEQNVAAIYTLTTQVSVYTPTLTQQPDAWTIVVKVNDSGDDNYLIGGPGNIAFDDRGYAWITNNVVQGTGNSGQFNFVLKPNGKPADGSGDTPKSPLVGGGLLGAGYGVGIAPDGSVWMGNFGWGSQKYYPSLDGNGSVSQFTQDGQPISGSLGYQGGPLRAMAVMPDADGNIWIASFGNNRVYVFLNGDPNDAVYYEDPDGNAQAPFDIQFAKDGTVWVTFSGGLKSGGPGYVGRFVLKNRKVENISLTQVGATIKAIAVDSYGQAWVASGDDNSVYLLDENGVNLKQFTSGGLSAPWGITTDGDDNVWVGNFGPQTLGNVFSNTCVTKLAGNNPATRPQGSSPGDPISPPATGYTLPSAGDEVRLHNGEPLYGTCHEAPKCYTPLMRITALAIDQAGNVWVTNNWKPSLDIDLFNPGGDGICIFVGMAKPRVKAANA